ncbi:hypothetical protein JFT81_08345 [Pseudomonas sp. TH43]|uniref:hypothetical protein n=1 Tax=Pseudomonas sp. TH43 TaxID=2796407 RepID=UPI001913C009|nr:hypothetical protein [Pseudomonas sp. TH43]MBK5374642.1 hypothetical protein [Pseudomonas sp. TH43]
MIKGLDKLQRDLTEASKALKELDGTIGSVEYDPNDPLSIEQAIAKIYRDVDSRVGSYASNPIVKPLIEQFKETARQHIIDKAAAARLSGGE